MKNSILVFLLLLCLAACADERNTRLTKATNADTAISTPIVKQEAPAPEGGKSQKGTPVPVDTVSSEKAGNHPISLHWIGWDKPGKATVTPAGNGWYTITGKQVKDQRNYLSIAGKIKRLSEKELEFDGTIETRVETIYGGEPCVRKGTQRFFGKGTRTYFRLQNMENCEGGNLVDYIDIYPGTSSL